MPVTLTGPLLPLAAPLGFCAVCAAAWKAACFESQSTEVTAADKAAPLTTIALAPDPPLAEPALAVSTGLAQLPAPPGNPAAGQPVLVPLPLCWTHLNAVQFLTGGIIAAPGPILLDGSGPPRS
jgi:hypothetical protein